MDQKRVVITGTGVVSCVGNSVAALWDSIVNGRSGLGPITKFDAKDFRTQIAGEVKDFNIENYMPAKEARRLDLFCQYAIVAADEAMKQAGLSHDLANCPGVDQTRVGVLVSSGVGGLKTMEDQCRVLFERGPSKVSPLLIPMMITDMSSGAVSMRYGAQGPNMCVTTACASACHSIGESFWMIKRGDADIMICGGAESTIVPIGFAGFCSMKAMSQRNSEPTRASRPFDRERDGFVMSDGAGVLIIEELEHAKKRGANILAEIIGYGASGDAYQITSPAPGGDGAARALKVAMKHACLNPEDIGYINAHGTSTDLNDKFETAAIKMALGQHAYKVPVSSTKSVTGHALGAAGGIETIICSLVLQKGVLPPTINYENPDPECDLDYVPNTARQVSVQTAVNINLGFGGHNGALILRRYS